MMIQSGDFFPNQQFVCTPQGLPDLTKADAYWRLMFDPSAASRRDIMAIFFAPGAWDERSRQNRRGAMNVAVSQLGSFATASDYTNENDEREQAKRDDRRRRAAGELDFFEDRAGSRGGGDGDGDARVGGSRHDSGEFDGTTSTTEMIGGRCVATPRASLDVNTGLPPLGVPAGTPTSPPFVRPPLRGHALRLFLLRTTVVDTRGPHVVVPHELEMDDDGDVDGDDDGMGGCEERSEDDGADADEFDDFIVADERGEDDDGDYDPDALENVDEVYGAADDDDEDDDEELGDAYENDEDDAEASYGDEDEQGDDDDAGFGC